MQAELRDVHLDVTDIKREQRMGLEGQARLDAERNARDEEFRQALLAKEQQRDQLATGPSRDQVSRHAIELLENSFAAMAGRNSAGRLELTVRTCMPDTVTAVVTYHEDARNTGSVERIYDEDHLQKEASRLECYIIGIETTSALLQEPPTLSLSYTMFYELQKWVKSRVSRMLWIAGPTDSNFRYPSTMSNAAASTVQLFTLTGLVVIYHFCELPEISAPINTLSREELGLISLVCSLIRQLMIAAGPQFESSLDFSRERFAQLNGSMEGFKGASQLLKDLVDMCLHTSSVSLMGSTILTTTKGEKVAGRSSKPCVN